MTGRCVLGPQVALYVLLSATAFGQMNGFSSSFGVTPNGVPASVTSFGFGGHPGFHGVAPSVTSLGFRSTAPVTNPAPFGFRKHHHHRYPFYGGYYAPYYSYPDYANSPDTNESEEDYRGGPTIFDRRGDGGQYRRDHESGDYRSELSPTPGAQEPAEAAQQPRTLLVFKDGHQLEIANYAIIGPTLYDLSEGRTRKIQLAELDLAATVKQNDERGVEFELPQTTKPN